MKRGLQKKFLPTEVSRLEVGTYQDVHIFIIEQSITSSALKKATIQD